MGEGIFNLLYWMYFPFIAVYFGSVLGLKIAGLLMTVPPFISMIFNMVGGTLADRYGRRPVMLLGAAIQTGMFAIFALSSSPWIDYVAYICIGIGGAIYGPASDAMVADLVPDTERKQVFASFITAKNIGAVLGPVFGAIFFFQYRNELLWTCTVVMLIYSIITFFKINETAPNSLEKVSQLKKFSLSVSLKREFENYLIIFRDKVFLLYILAGIFSMMTIMQLDLYLAIYITDYVPSQTIFTWGNHSINLSSKEILGWMLGLNGLLFVLFVLPVTKWFKHWNDREVFILSCVLAGIGMFAVGLTANFWLLLIVTIVFTFGEIVRSPVMNNFVSQYAPKDARGQYMGASSLQYTFGRFIAPLTVILSAWFSPIVIFSLILLCALISLTLYIKLFKVQNSILNGYRQ